MATFINPAGSPAVIYNGRTSYTHQELADACRQWGPKLNVPAGIDGTRLLWAFAGRESSFGADCRPRHEAAYCTGYYSKHTDVVAATKRWGHLAHCSFGPWQMLHVNDNASPNPELYTDIIFAACRTVTFFNTEIFGHQQAGNLQQAALAWNTGNFRTDLPTDYSIAVQHFYDSSPVPPAAAVGA